MNYFKYLVSDYAVCFPLKNKWRVFFSRRKARAKRDSTIKKIRAGLYAELKATDNDKIKGQKIQEYHIKMLEILSKSLPGGRDETI